MTPRQPRKQRVRTRKQDPGDYYFQHLPVTALDDIPEPSLNSLENEINMMRFLIKFFFDQLVANITDFKELGIAITKIGSVVMQVSRLINIHHQSEGEETPANQLRKVLEKILNDAQDGSSGRSDEHVE